MPRPRIEAPAPSSVRDREYRKRQRLGLVSVRIGDWRGNVTADTADRLREIADAAQKETNG